MGHNPYDQVHMGSNSAKLSGVKIHLWVKSWGELKNMLKDKDMLGFFAKLDLLRLQLQYFLFRDLGFFPIIVL